MKSLWVKKKYIYICEKSVAKKSVGDKSAGDKYVGEKCG